MITFRGSGSREGKRDPEFVLHDHKAVLSEPVACTVADLSYSVSTGSPMWTTGPDSILWLLIYRGHIRILCSVGLHIFWGNTE